MINIGFIGLGGMGRAQATAFAKIKGCKIYAGADLSNEARRSFEKEYEDARIYEHYENLLNDDGLDGVVIAVPTLYHKDVGLNALQAKVPTLMEKPLARTVADCKKLIEQAKASNTTLMVGHCRRFDPVWGAWKKPVIDGELGSPVLWRHVMAGSGPGRWFMDKKLGGGPLIDGAIHNYDFANWMWGDPSHVVASSIKLVPGATAIDTATAVVHYPNNNQLMVSWSWGTNSRGDSLFDVIGEKAALKTGPGAIPLNEGDENKNESDFYHIAKNKGKDRLIRVPKNKKPMLRKQAEHFIDCIKNKAKCQSPATEAIKAVAVGEAILKAAKKQGKAMISW